MVGRFVGDVSPRITWQGLVADPEAVLIDVRTRAEWAYVGGPDLSSLKRPVIQVEWQQFPNGTLNPKFADEVAAKGVGPEHPVYLICRSGVRSLAAAGLLADAYGFEGQIDAAGHRGTLNGWKAEDLPWRQS